MILHLLASSTFQICTIVLHYLPTGNIMGSLTEKGAHIVDNLITLRTRNLSLFFRGFDYRACPRG